MKWTSELRLLKDYHPSDTYNEIIIAGPCAIESHEQIEEISEFLKELGIDFMRGGAYKHRTSPYSFSGLGEKGLKIISDVCRANKQLVVSEILSIDQLPLFDKYVDIIMIGARSMRNYPLIHSTSKLGKPMIIKRSMDSTLKDWLFAAEHAFYHGAKDVILCERGVKTFDPEFRNILDISSASFITENYNIPLIVDPSHGTGVKEIMGKVAKAFLAIGAKGYMLEIHNNPAIAKCDAEQALTFEEFKKIYDSHKEVLSPLNYS